MPVRQVRRRVRYYSFAGRGGSGTTAVVRMGCMNVCGLPAERRPKTAKDGNRAASANTRTCRQGRRAQLSVCHSGRPCLRFHAWSRPLVSGMRALGMRRINSWGLWASHTVRVVTCTLFALSLGHSCSPTSRSRAVAIYGGTLSPERHGHAFLGTKRLP